MTPAENAYVRLIQEGRRLYYSDVLPFAIDTMVQEYAKLVSAILRDVGTGKLSAERGAVLMKSIADRLDMFTTQTAQVLNEARARALMLAVESHASAMIAASTVARVSVAADFGGVAIEAMEMMQARRGLGLANSFKTLINRHVTEVADDVERLIFDGVGRGQSARDLSIDLAKIMAKNDPEVLSLLDRSNGALAKAARHGAPVDSRVIQRARSLISDARRIAVTEINTSYFEADRVGNAESPVIKLVRWELSGRHEGLRTSPDVCDYYAYGDLHGFGPGLFHPETVPALPHPYCGCSINPITRPPEEWNDPKLPIPQVTPGTAAELQRIFAANRSTARSPRAITPKFIQRQLRMADAGTNNAYELVKSL